MSARRALPLVTSLILFAACSSGASGDDGTPATSASSTSVVVEGSPPSTVGGVGVLPGPLPTQAIEEIASTTTVPRPESTERTVGALADGNRVLMIGDSILASTSKRYTNNMCNALVPLGWQVAIEAEVSRQIEFGNRVLDDRYEEGWDAGLVLLGNNYDGDEQRFLNELNEIVDRFEGKPVALLTVTEFREDRVEVNEVIEAVADLYDNVILVDWASMSRYEGVLSADGLHLTDGGREVLAQVLVPFFDVAPDRPGECLDSEYTDDSAGGVDGGPPTTSRRPSGNRPGTTVRPPSSTNPPTGTTQPSTGTTQPPTGTTQPPVETTQPPVETQPTVPVTLPPVVTNPPPPPPTDPPPPQTEPPIGP